MPEIISEIEIPDVPEDEAAVPVGDSTDLLPEASGLTPEQVHSQLWLLLQSVLDAMPDDATIFIRKAIAAQNYTDAANSLLFAALRHRIQLTDIEYAVLAECLVALQEDTENMAYLTVAAGARPLFFEYLADPAELNPEATEPDAAAAALDDQMIVSLGELPIVGMWRAWRVSATRSAWPPPRPMYLIEAPDSAAAKDLLANFYGEDAELGELDPLVDIYLTGQDIPPLHRAIQFAGTVVHAENETPEFTFADVFEGEPDESGAPQNLQKLSPEVAEPIAEYLLSGKPLMMADTAGEDLLDPDKGAVVPLHLRTDGLWVWSEASAYYLTEHLIAPPEAFLAYLQQTQAPIVVSDTLLHQAAAWLQEE